jgi:hypothetical protein
MSQEIGYVTLSHGMSLVITLTKDWSSPLKAVSTISVYTDNMNDPIAHKMEVWVLLQGSFILMKPEP